MTNIADVKTETLWCYRPETGNDKVYTLTFMRTSHGCDVFARFGRRGGKQTFFIHAENAPEDMALGMYNAVRREKTGARKGYKVVDMVPVGKF
jgi:hypothetical protein